MKTIKISQIQFEAKSTPFKNAELLNEIESFGFGHVEVGTITPKEQYGNEKPRVFRLEKDQALINRLGFNNDGSEIVKNRIENVKDKTVIDLGAGSGILCYLAVKYGAKKVYALERKGRLIHRMKEILGDSVEYIHADLLEVNHLPECDIYLHEWLTSEFWNEKRNQTQRNS